MSQPAIEVPASTCTTTTCEPGTLAKLEKIAAKLEAEARKTDADLVAWLHAAIGDDPPELEVQIDGRRYLSCFFDGNRLVVDLALCFPPFRAR